MIGQKIYIKGAAAISPQNTFENNALPTTPKVSVDNRFQCMEPVYSEYLNPVMARRMGRIVKMGIAAAIKCLSNAKVEMPGAVITGTALGCLGDTEKFLTAVIKDDEQYLTPTWFIQSLQNTVAAQIALHLKCTNHNFTFVHKGFSFESALLDACMLMHDNEADNVLVGGLDEMTDHNFHIYGRLNKWKKERVESDVLLNYKNSQGTIAGEGAAFFVLTKQKYPVALEAIDTIYGNETGKIIDRINLFIEEHAVYLNENTLVLYGLNGDENNDLIYRNLMNGKFKQCKSGYFKHLCGEYQTSSSFAMWLGFTILESGKFPEYLKVLSGTKSFNVENVLIVNHYENNYSFMHLSKGQ